MERFKNVSFWVAAEDTGMVLRLVPKDKDEDGEPFALTAVPSFS